MGYRRKLLDVENAFSKAKLKKRPKLINQMGFSCNARKIRFVYNGGRCIDQDSYRVSVIDVMMSFCNLLDSSRQILT